MLDLTRDVAHGVARPAAPLTAYLVGVAVGRGLALSDAARRIAALAASGAGRARKAPDPGTSARLPGFSGFSGPAPAGSAYRRGRPRSTVTGLLQITSTPGARRPASP